MYIIKINSEYDMNSGELSRLVRIHKTPTEDVAIVYTDDPVAGGFAVLHADIMPDDLKKTIKPSEVLDRSFSKVIAKRKRDIRREAKLGRQRAGGKV